jgi:hypothetical protein
MVQVKISHLVGAVFTAILGIGGTGLSFWQETKSQLDISAERTQHNYQLIDQRLTRIENAVQRIEDREFLNQSSITKNHVK